LRAGLEAKFKSLSVRKVFAIAQIRRSTHYSRLKSKPEQLRQAKDQALVVSFKQVRSEYLCWGFEMIYAHLRHQKGQLFCKKRAHKLYKQAGLSLHKTPKKPRIKREYQDLLSANQVNQGWALDFVSDMVVNQMGSVASEWIRVINVIDECSRKDLWVEAYKSIKANKVVEILDNLLKMRGKPAYIRTDNGPEFISNELKKWAEDNRIEQKFIQPGKPTQNGLIERLNGTLRRECLNLNWFTSLEELNEYLGNWYQSYNFERPHSSLGYLTPAQFEEKNASLYFNLVAA
jgi:putative transposase